MKTVIYFFFSVFASVSLHARRLPTSVLPLHYDLVVNTNLDGLSFNGGVSITMTAAEGTNNVTLHSKDLNVTDVRLVDSGVSVIADSVQQQMDFLEVRFSSSLVVNRTYVLAMEFSGSLRSDGVGFYWTTYMDQENIKRYIAATHFEPIYARSVFPCFDEPNLKATFRISLIREASSNTVSNMNSVGSLPYLGDPSRMIDVYDVSPKMSTYSVTFAVLGFPKVSDSDGTNFVYARNELLDHGDGAYALTTGRKIMETMRNLTSVNCTTSKIDHVAVPSRNFGFDAVGNLGAITYRFVALDLAKNLMRKTFGSERNLVYNEGTVTAGETQMIAISIARGIAHQWFGNSVTPQWWKYVWLSEGFATYFGMVLTDQLEPTWAVMEQFVTSVMQPALEADASDSSEAMTRNVETPPEIHDDPISSNKAASVIRMISVVLGEKAFRSGITSYLTKWRLDNVEPADLYRCWQEASGNVAINVTQFLQTWETQPGYPVVTVTRDYERYTTLSQKRFRLDTNGTDDGSRWIIPVSWFAPNTASDDLTMLSSDTNLTLNVPAEDWIVFNYNREGFYRVAYDETNWLLLTSALLSNLSQFPVRNRAQFIDDAFNLARAGLLDYQVAFEIGKYIAEEEEYVPIAAFTNALGYLDRITRGTVHNSNIREYGIEILEKVYEKLGFEFPPADTHVQKLTRANVLTSLCDLGYEECRSKSSEAFLAWSVSGDALHPDSQAIILCNALRNSTNSVNWATNFNAYFATRDEKERSRIAGSFGCFDYDVMLNTTLDLLMLRDLDFNRADRVAILTSILSTDVGLVLDFLTRDFTAADEIIGSMPAVIKDIVGRITTEDFLERFRIFAETNEQYFSESFRSTVSIALADAEYNLRWLTEVTPQFDSYFSSVTEGPGGGNDDGAVVGKISIPILIFSFLIASLN